MSSKADLRVDWCSHEAARYAVEHWHYSKRMPVNKLAKLGVWEDGKFIGAVIFGTGACANLARPYGLANTEVCELVRVALRSHKSEVSKILKICIKFIRNEYRNLKMIISFADPSRGHHGGIYQAMGWIHDGVSERARGYEHEGRIIHRRGGSVKFRSKIMSGAIKEIKGTPKYRYLFPLDMNTKSRLILLSKPYPKRAKQAMAVPTAQRRGSADLHAPILESEE